MKKCSSWNVFQSNQSSSRSSNKSLRLTPQSPDMSASVITCWTILSRVLPHGKQYPPEYCHMLNDIVYNFYYGWSFIHAREVRTRGADFLCELAVEKVTILCHNLDKFLAVHYVTLSSLSLLSLHYLFYCVLPWVHFLCVCFVCRYACVSSVLSTFIIMSFCEIVFLFTLRLHVCPSSK